MLTSNEIINFFKDKNIETSSFQENWVKSFEKIALNLNFYKDPKGFDEDLIIQLLQTVHRRRQEYRHYKETMDQFLSFLSKDPSICARLADKLFQVQALFLTQVSENTVEGATYHTYAHSVEMSRDPGMLLTYLINEMAFEEHVILFIKQLANTLGAAHDIIQTKGSPANEINSEMKLFEEMTKAFLSFIKEEKLSFNDTSIFKAFINKTLPFLSHECLVYATYLIFPSGMRDFASLCNQLEQTLYGKSVLDPLTKAIQLAITISDTRRSSLKFVTQEKYTLKKIPDHLMTDVEALLEMVGLLNSNEKLKNIQDVDRFSEIEGFLIRLGQNIKMCAELALKSKTQDEESKHHLSNLIKQGMLHDPVVFYKLPIDSEKHIIPLFKRIKDEITVAHLFESTDEENYLILEKENLFFKALKPQMDFSAWKKQVSYLKKIDEFYEAMTQNKEIDNSENDEKLKKLVISMIFFATQSSGLKGTEQLTENIRKRILCLDELMNETIPSMEFNSDIGTLKMRDLTARINNLKNDLALIAIVTKREQKLLFKSDKANTTFFNPDSPKVKAIVHSSCCSIF